MEPLLEQLIQSPKLGLYARQIERILAEEQQKRHDFYNRITEEEKVEFINGEIIYHSPVKFRHNMAAKLLLKLLDTFVQSRQLGYVGYEKLMISLSRNDYEPDICFFGRAKAQQFSPDQVRFPAPDWVIEILSESTAAIDRGIKWEDYAAHGIPEYWIVDPVAQMVEQFGLQGERYELKRKSDTGRLKSLVLPGFEIPIRAIFDEAENLKTLQKILAE
jgi:Uma2 family endonuclease